MGSHFTRFAPTKKNLNFYTIEVIVNIVSVVYVDTIVFFNFRILYL